MNWNKNKINLISKKKASLKDYLTELFCSKSELLLLVRIASFEKIIFELLILMWY